jgi:hypothetical protein
MLVDNEEGFLEAYGSAFNTGVPGVVKTTELRTLAHDRDGGVLEDTLLLGDTALVNRTVVGVPCEVVGPDGSAMTVAARWDGDVWVEVDDCLLMETRRWKEGDRLVVARTVTKPDGVLVTSKTFMGKPKRRAPTFAAPPAPAEALPAGKKGKKLKKAEEKAAKKAAAAALAAATKKKGGGDDDDDDAKSDAGSDAGSVYSQVANAVGGFGFGGLFGGGGGDNTDAGKDGNKKDAGKTAKGVADGAKAAKFFNLDPATLFCGAFACSLRGTAGHVYVFEFAIGFAAKNLADTNKWSTPARVVNNLEIDGPTSLVVGLATGLTLSLTDVPDRDAVYDCMVGMLEKLPPSPGEDVHGDPDGRVAVPLRVGFDPERYVIVHIIHAGFLPDVGLVSKSNPVRPIALESAW